MLHEKLEGKLATFTDRREVVALFEHVRALLLRQLTLDSDPTSSYHLTHTRLQTHFHTRATHAMQGDELVRIEEAYHALALGDPEPAIQVGIDAQIQILHSGSRC